MWLNDEIQEKYPELADKADELLLHSFLLLWLSAPFSTVTDILRKKRYSLDIVGRNDLHIRLSQMIQMIPYIPSLVREHQAQGTR